MYDPIVKPPERLVAAPGKKPVLYQDIDGCLFGHYGEPSQFQLRPGVTSYLQWACTHFDVRWLTCWGELDVKWLLRTLYISPKRLGVALPVYTHWDQFEFKHDAIDYAADFYWVDDAPDWSDMAHLKERGKLDRFIHCDPLGIDSLDEVRKKLEATLGARANAA